LKYLSLCHNEEITGELFDYIPNLEGLCLGQNKKISKADIKKLEKLKYLDLYANDFIEEDGIDSLVCSIIF
jgi:hypothetical protein